MCLSEIKFYKPINDVDSIVDRIGLKKIKYKNQLWYVGWKVVGKTCDNSKSLFTLYDGRHAYNTILKETFRKQISIDGHKSYKSGFHVILTRESCREYKRNYSHYYRKHKIVKVLFRKPKVYGEQYNSAVVVCDEICIPKEYCCEN